MSILRIESQAFSNFWWQEQVDKYSQQPAKMTCEGNVAREHLMTSTAKVIQARIALLRALEFGSEVAEEEAKRLRKYFLKTSAWQRMLEGQVDVIRGAKGSGKSAIYVLLLDHRDELKEKHQTTVINAEELVGEPVFQDIAKQDPPATENEFLITWKFYFLLLLARRLDEIGVKDSMPGRELIASLTRLGIFDPKEKTLAQMARRVVNYAKRLSATVSLSHDPNTGMVTPSVTFQGGGADKSKKHEDLVEMAWPDINDLFAKANQVLEDLDLHAWITLDRLDVAFRGAEIDDPERLETNALRALTRTYIDLKKFDRLSIKIFLREDVWNFVTSMRAFPEASHITKQETLRWDRRNLLGLIGHRLAENHALCEHLDIKPSYLRRFPEKSLDRILERIPSKGENGTDSATGIDLILSEISDGQGMVTPREVIHFFKALVRTQLGILDEKDSDTDVLDAEAAVFEVDAIERSILEVSERKLQTFLFAEYPHVKRHVEMLKGCNRLNSMASLCQIWDCDREKAAEISDELIALGVMRRLIPGVTSQMLPAQMATGRRVDPLFEVVSLYAEALKMRAGSGLLDYSEPRQH